MRQWVNTDRTVLVRFWDEQEKTEDGLPVEMEVATRDDSDAVWGPPRTVVRDDR